MTALTALYIIGLVTGIGLIFYSLVHRPKHKSDMWSYDGINTNKRLEEHWNVLAQMARDIVPELKLPFGSEVQSNALDFIPDSYDFPGKQLLRFDFSDICWELNDYGCIKLEVEWKSPLTFNCLITHLNTQYPTFHNRFEDWRKTCTKYIWGDSFVAPALHDKTDDLLHTFKLAASSRFFKGTCEICKDIKPPTSGDK